MLGVSTRGIERAVRRGQLTVQYRDSKHGKKAWFRPADLERYRSLTPDVVVSNRTGDGQRAERR